MLELEIPKDLEHLTTYQLDFYPKFRRIVFEVKIRGPYSKSGLSIVEIFGHEVPYNKLEKIFCGSKQSYIIPAHIYVNKRSDLYKRSYTIANTANDFFIKEIHTELLSQIFARYFASLPPSIPSTQKAKISLLSPGPLLSITDKISEILLSV